MVITMNSDPTLVVKETFNLLKIKHGFTARISEITNMIEETTGIELDIDSQESWSPMVLSKLLDFQSTYIKGDSLDLGKVKEYIYSQFEIGKRSQLLLEKSNIEEKLWSIFMIISKPSQNYYNI